MYVYDFKFPDLSEIAYNHLLNNQNGYKKVPTFYVINFDDPARSHRCNPINPAFMTDISDAYESAYTIMLNLNKTWVQKQGDFFRGIPHNPFGVNYLVSPHLSGWKILYVPSCHRISEQTVRRYFPHSHLIPGAGKLSQSPLWMRGSVALKISSGPDSVSENSPFRMISPQLYWIMSGDEFTLDINNPDEPKVLVVGNNPDRQNIYGAALGLYNSRIVKLINKKGQLKSSVIIDELPTIYFKGLDNLIATAGVIKYASYSVFRTFRNLNATTEIKKPLW